MENIVKDNRGNLLTTIAINLDSLIINYKSILFLIYYVISSNVNENDYFIKWLLLFYHNPMCIL